MKAKTNGKYWHKIEADLRFWAFHIYFDKTFKDEREPMLRYLKALEASCRPVRNRSLVLWWDEHNGQVTDDDIKALSI